MKIKKSLSLQKNEDTKEISFYNGENQIIEVSNIGIFWDLLKKYDDKRAVQKWQNSNDITEEEFNEIETQLLEYGILYSEDVQVNQYEQRLFNFLSTYDTSLNSSNYLNTLHRKTAVIIGCGTLGSTLSASLTKIGVNNLILIDDDIVNKHNINSQHVFNKNDLGKFKTECIKRSIMNQGLNCNIDTFNIKITEIDDLLNIIENYRIDYIINTFDEIDEKLHLDLIDYIYNYNITYYMSGYFNDFTTIFKINDLSLNNFIKDSFKNFNRENIINNNRGIITNSLFTSLLITNSIIKDILDNTLPNTEKWTYNFRDMTLIHENSYLDTPELNFLKKLETIFPPEYLTNKIFNLNRYLEEGLSDYYEYIENFIIETNQLFETLEETRLMQDSRYLDIHNEFLQLIDKFESLNSEEIEFNSYYNDYITVIGKIQKDRNNTNSTNIYEDTLNISLLESKKDKKTLQEGIACSIKVYSNELLEIIKKQKLEYLNINQEEFHEEVLGVSADNLNNFESYLENKYEELYSEFYINEFTYDNTIDYFNTKDKKIDNISSIQEALNIIKNVLKTNPEFKDIEILLDDLIVNENIYIPSKNIQNNINKTIFFPSRREGLIVTNFDCTYESFLTLVHEIGHYYYDRFYKDNMFISKSNNIINETLAHYFQYKFVRELCKGKQYNTLDKDEILKKYKQRVLKLCLSSFSIRLIEKDIIDLIVEQGSLGDSDYLNIRNQRDSVEEKYSPIKNKELYVYNLLLYPEFGLNYKTYSVDPLSIMIALNLIHQNIDNDTLKSYLKNSEYFNIDNFSKDHFGCEFNIVIDVLVKNYIHQFKYIDQW